MWAWVQLWKFRYSIWRLRKFVDLEAEKLIVRDGEQAFMTACEFSRVLRDGGKTELARYWDEVALTVARRQGALRQGSPGKGARIIG